MKFWQIAAASVTLGATLPVVAQVPATPAAPAVMAAPARADTRAEVETRVRDRLGQFDANRDGTVTREEMMAFAETRMKASRDERFAAMDTDKNGSISRAEFDVAPAAGAMARMRGAGDGVRVMRYRQQGMGGTEARGEGWRGKRGERMADGMGGRMRMMMIERGGAGMGMMADGNGKIVVADAVKKALERFDTVDTNKDGTISVEERRAAREARRMMRMSRAKS